MGLMDGGGGLRRRLALVNEPLRVALMAARIGLGGEGEVGCSGRELVMSCQVEGHEWVKLKRESLTNFLELVWRCGTYGMVHFGKARKLERFRSVGLSR